jgi:hypothetical protein
MRLRLPGSAQFQAQVPANAEIFRFAGVKTNENHEGLFESNIYGRGIPF